jgi:peptidoglycan/LPS O-acetylase OafA/YrhL
VATPPQAHAGSEHRTDIEGLRGVAVLAVLAVHAWPELLRGGFVGVDIFFVLSGYLITGLMWDALAQGRFSLWAFYQRRVLRLFPALCAVMLCCAVAALFTFPSEARQIGKHLAASAVFSSNIALWQEAGYFDASSESKPLLHLWSLGIEEQFYLLWPLALPLLFRWRQHAFKLVLLLLLASFVLNVMWVVPKAKGTFFLLPTRAWELLVGAGLATLQHHGSGVPALARLAGRWRRHPALRWLPDGMAAAGALMIAAAFLLLDNRSAFPGWWALLPTLGTALLLAAGAQAWLNRRVLSHRVMVFYGSISYPLYLWHWPLLVFPLLLGFTMDNALRVVVLAASVGLAALTMEYIERPIRRGTRSPRVVGALWGTLACIGLAGLGLNWSDGLLGTYPPLVREIARADLAAYGSGYRSHRCFLDLEQGPGAFTAECWPEAKAHQGVTLLWGDSHAAALYPGLAAAIETTAHGVAEPGVPLAPPTALAQFTKARCPPLGAPPAAASRQCQEVNEHVWRRIAQQVPQTVILAGYWSLYVGDGRSSEPMLASLLQTVQGLRSLGVDQVVVMGHLPTWKEPLPRALLRAWERDGQVPERLLSGLDRHALQLDDDLRRAMTGSGARFVSPIEHLCNALGCLTTLTAQGVAQPLVNDESHLTLAGSVALVQRSQPLLAH